MKGAREAKGAQRQGAKERRSKYVDCLTLGVIQFVKWSGLESDPVWKVVI